MSPTRFHSPASRTMAEDAPPVPVAAAGAPCGETPGVNGLSASLASLHDHFRHPPVAFGPIPFYWWSGEKLERERIAWQLDQLAAKGVRQTIISYPHGADGENDPGTPPVFSPEWWDLFRWFLDACGERGMTTGIQDYTLVAPILQGIGESTRGMQGGQMSCVGERFDGPSEARLAGEPGSLVLGAWAYRDPGQAGDPSAPSAETLDLTPLVRDGKLEWPVPPGHWLVALVFARLNAFDPMHPDAGKLAIERLYAPFERECPEALGKTMGWFFQDELDFGARMPFWSNHLFDAFRACHGYDLRPWLPALWQDLGARTEKIRLDFADAVTARVEDCYFKPVFDWHREHGTMFGHDNCGRGRMALGRSHYGDYFRAMRWYSAPGCDDPKLQGERAFKGLKVNSSIAHHYQRPRVWVEAFHSSGWGTTPAEVVAAINEDFAYGATVVNLHGLYYSTRGGWWEWAPPDFHFRQPYWEHCGTLNAYLTRLSWLLSQGTRQCDVAMVYPIAALDAAPADPSAQGVFAHVGNHALSGTERPGAGPEESAFQLGKFLFDRSCDFDFIDHQSLGRAVATDGELRVSHAAYRVLLFPAMQAVRLGCLEMALEFARAGGTVIAYGQLPVATENAGRKDPLVRGLLDDIFGAGEGERVKHHAGGGSAHFLPLGFARVLETINRSVDRDVLASVVPLHVLHRRLESAEVYYLFNPAQEAVATGISLRATGAVEHWDAWTGETRPANPPPPPAKGRTTLSLAFAAREAKIVVFHNDTSANPAPLPPVVSPREEPAEDRVIPLDGPWQTALHPTLDNRHGDFRLPAGGVCLGAEARRFRCAEEFDAAGTWHTPGFDDEAWPETTYSFGKRFEVLGPLAPGAETAATETALLASGAAPRADWRPYAFSLRLGIERDPFLTHWLSGPHGLKGQVPDDYLDFHCDTPGSVCFFRAEFDVPENSDIPFLMGGRCAHSAWIDGVPVLEQPDALPPGLHAPWSIPHYDSVPRVVPVRLAKGRHRLLLKLVQPDGQRTRAHVAFGAAVDPGGETVPRLRWFRDPAAPRPMVPATAGRRAIWFRFLAAPGMHALRVTARGPLRAWADGAEMTVTQASPSGTCDGSMVFQAVAGIPHTRSVMVALRVEAPPDSHAGDALPEPVEMLCGDGEIPAGDWCQHGLATYSGSVEYRKSIHVPADRAAGRILLDLGDVRATAGVRVNGQSAGALVAPPWIIDITPLVKPGKNDLSITVANTLANHYSVGIPTPYAFPEQNVSGLLGPVRLFFRQC